MKHPTVKRRAFAALEGLAAGDALGWPALFHRSYAYPFWTRRLRREMDVSAEDARVLPPQMPFSLNQPTEPFATGGTDDAEWCAFVMRAHLAADLPGDAWVMAEAWGALASEEAGTVRGGVSVQAALRNLRAGLAPPASGSHNPHYFDDGACSRAVPLGVLFAGRPDAAAAAARADAEVTNAEDGVWAAEAVAAGLAVACAGGSSSDLIEAALGTLPAQSWSRRVVEHALRETREATSLLEASFILSANVVNRAYNYGNAAPETLAVALALVGLADGDGPAAVTAATAVAKTADAAPSLVGAFCGALSGSTLLSDATRRTLPPMRGLCVPALHGVDFYALADQWSDLAATNPAPASS